MVAVGVVIGLGTAGPALASDGQAPPIPSVPEPVVPVPEVPQPELPTVPVPDPLAAPGPDPVPDPTSEAAIDTETTPDARSGGSGCGNGRRAGHSAGRAPEVTTSTQSDGGNVNVSVRVNSPGEEAPVVQEGPDPAVVSPPAQPDITPVAGIVASESDGSGSTDSPAGFPATPADDSTNTNVTVRVSSPGDNDPVTQTTASADPQDEAGG